MNRGFCSKFTNYELNFNKNEVFAIKGHFSEWKRDLLRELIDDCIRQTEKFRFFMGKISSFTRKIWLLLEKNHFWVRRNHFWLWKIYFRMGKMIFCLEKLSFDMLEHGQSRKNIFSLKIHWISFLRIDFSSKILTNWWIWLQNWPLPSANGALHQVQIDCNQ